MKLFKYYIKQKLYSAAAWAAVCGIFAVCFALYHLPLKAVLYPAALCTLFGIIAVIIDFLHKKRKYNLLLNIRCINDIIGGVLPEPECIEDEAYQNILRLAAEEYISLRTLTDRKYSDTVDYYTVWAHQIKTPIASMRLNLQNEDSAQSRRLSADLLRIEQYVEMVLTFLRLDSKSSDYVIKEYQLDPIIKQAIKKFAGEFITRRLKLVYKPANIAVITDEKWLLFVIEQVLSNALKYTPSGSITISVDDNKRLCISDTGIGIAPEDIPRIFENGYTGYNGRIDKKASGIGLYLCKRICTKLGHTLEVSSTVGKGTVIAIGLAQNKLETE